MFVLSPATLLLIERLIAVLTILVQALEQAAGKPSIRRNASRFVLSGIVAHLTRLRDSNRAAAPSPEAPLPTPCHPIRQPDSPPAITDEHPVSRHTPHLTIDTPLPTAPTAPHTPPLSKSPAAPALTHAYFITI